MSDQDLEVVPLWNPLPRWPNGGEAEPLTDGSSYLTDATGLIYGISGPVDKITREEWERRKIGGTHCFIDLDHHVANGDSR